MYKTFCEIFTEVNNAPTKEHKIAILKKNETPAMRGLFKINFNKEVSMGLPEGIPPFRKNDAPLGTEHDLLFSAYRKFYIWLDPKQNLPALKRESLFVGMLESLHETEAVLICNIKDKKLQEMYPTITEELIREVFPMILPPVSEVPPSV